MIYRTGLLNPTYDKRWKSVLFCTRRHPILHRDSERSQGSDNHSCIETSGNHSRKQWQACVQTFCGKNVGNKYDFQKEPAPCLQGSGCSLVSQAWEMEHIMAFREPVAHSWTSSWVTSAVCAMPPEVNFRDSASCRRGSGCCASTNSARYLCKAQVITCQAQINLEFF